MFLNDNGLFLSKCTIFGRLIWLEIVWLMSCLQIGYIELSSDRRFLYTQSQPDAVRLKLLFG